MFRYVFLICLLSTMLMVNASAEVVEGTIAIESESPWIVLLPDDYDAGKEYPLIVGLHGYGDTASNFSRRWIDENDDLGYIFLFPQAPWPFSEDDENEGFAWYFWYGEEVPRRCLDASIEYIRDIVEEISSIYSVDEDNICTGVHHRLCA